jgi:hypothetical protein
MAACGKRLCACLIEGQALPALDLPRGLGKTSATAPMARGIPNDQE